MIRVLVMSAIIGPVDSLHVPVKQDGCEAEYVVYTDQRYSSKHWRIQEPREWQGSAHAEQIQATPEGHLRNNLIGKWYKWQSHKIPETLQYDWTIWLDGSIVVNSPDFFVDLIGAAQTSRHKFGVFKHPKRDCGFAEAAFCVNIPKYAPWPLEKQYAAYKEAGQPEHTGLWAAGLQAKRFPEAAAFCDAIWEQTVLWGAQDQVSMSHVAWRLGNPGTFDPPGYFYWTKYWTKANHLPGYQELGKK